MSFQLPSTTPFVAKKKGSITFAIADSDGVCHTLEGDVPFSKGDVICTNADPKGKGESWPVQAEKFYNKYDVTQSEEVDGSLRGSAVPKGKPVLAWEITQDMVGPDGKLHVPVGWADNGELTGEPGKHVLVCYGPGDYGVVDKEIFEQTYGIMKSSDLTPSERKEVSELVKATGVPHPFVSMEVASIPPLRSSSNPKPEVSSQEQDSNLMHLR